MNTIEQRHIEMLQRRADHLDRLVNDWKGKPGGDSWSRKERDAIEWALSIVKERA